MAPPKQGSSGMGVGAPGYCRPAGGGTVEGVGQSVGRSISQSVGRSVSRSVGQSVGRSISRSVGRSVSRSVGKSVGRSPPPPRISDRVAGGPDAPPMISD
eukprot:383372-Prorocentrum_minimum.AAC.1